MNANRNIKIDFRIMRKTPDGKFIVVHDHYIQKNKGKHIDRGKATKRKKR